jgi:hypothetical protein
MKEAIIKHFHTIDEDIELMPNGHNANGFELHSLLKLNLLSYCLSQMAHHAVPALILVPLDAMLVGFNLRSCGR